MQRARQPANSDYVGFAFPGPVLCRMESSAVSRLYRCVEFRPAEKVSRLCVPQYALTERQRNGGFAPASLSKMAALAFASHSDWKKVLR